VPDLPSDLYVMGIDPGKAKCGVAVLSLHGKCIERSIVSKADLGDRFFTLAECYPLQAVVVGNRTGSRETHALLKSILTEQGKDPEVILQVVEEHNSSVEARRRYLLEHRTGWRRIVPIGLQTPDEPYDDYTAEVLALRYLDSMKIKP
jgi:RNase H-fold protein (predicted Holliday junction resolvase)